MAYFTTADNNFSCSKWIVNPIPGLGTHTTISAALSDASSGDTIYIMPGQYTEDLSLKAGVNLCSFICDRKIISDALVSIIGKCTASFSGTAGISGINLQTNSDNAISISGASTVLNVFECSFTGDTSTVINMSAGTLYINSCNCTLNNEGAIFNQSGGTLDIVSFYDDISNLHTTSSTISGGSFTVYQGFFGQPITTSSTAALSLNYTEIRPSGNNTALICGGSGAHTISQAIFSSGSAVSLTVNNTTTLTNSSLNSSNANAIDGSGTLNYGSLTFVGNSGMTTNTRNPLNLGQRLSVGSSSLQILSGAGSPDTVITAPKGSLYLRTNGTTTNDRAFINTNGGTSWTAIITSS